MLNKFSYGAPYRRMASLNNANKALNVNSPGRTFLLHRALCIAGWSRWFPAVPPPQTYASGFAAHGSFRYSSEPPCYLTLFRLYYSINMVTGTMFKPWLQ